MARGTALVTGSSSGIGAELARLCAADGYNLVLVARRADRLESLGAELARAHEIQARALPADLADPAAPEAIFRAMAETPVDILINNAGFAVHGPFAEVDWERQARLLQVNMVALAHLTRLFLPHMLTRRSGRILNVASTAAFFPGPLMATYYASKAFVLSFSEAVANEVEGTGVTATVLCPGVTETDFFETAGITGSTLVRNGGMTAAQVAREGYDGMMAGKMEVIPGTRNRWMTRAGRLAPRTILARITRRLNSTGE